MLFRTGSLRPLSADMSEWNPFGDDNFDPLADEFGREFDRLRRGSNSSE